ncbi:MAG: STAS domain-containing protein [Treponema sp.]|nr:STAS domain-containing protein [Treponema sp.]
MTQDRSSKESAHAYQMAWNGSLSIEQAQNLYLDLVKAFAQSQHVVLDLSDVTDMDTAVIQLICAASKEASNRGAEFQVSGKLREELQSKLQRYGFVSKITVSGQGFDSQWCMQGKV